MGKNPRESYIKLDVITSEPAEGHNTTDRSVTATEKKTSNEYLVNDLGGQVPNSYFLPLILRD